jgi:hypothetical protein
MPLYTLNRNYLLRTGFGVISFAKGEPTNVPPLMERDAQMIGAERVDGDAPPLLDPEKEPVQQVLGDERKNQIFIAFEKIVAKNDAKEFTAQGVPSVKAVERIVAFDVERSELVEFWQEFRTKDAA